MANRLKTTYSRLLLLSPFARMAELVDAHDSNSCSERSVGSIPTSGTKKALKIEGFFIHLFSRRLLRAFIFAQDFY